MTLRQQQGLIGLQILISVPCQIAFTYVAFQSGLFAGPVTDDLANRIGFALQNQLFAILALLAMIGFIAGARPLASDVIDGNDQAERLAVQVRIQRNTLEQFLLLATAHLALATTLPTSLLPILPVLVTLFILARIFYWIGYSINPIYRTFGFVATFYPNIAALIWATTLVVQLRF